MTASRDQITDILHELKAEGADERACTDRLFALLLAELRGLAHAFLARERDGHTLQPTALVNEAYVRLVGGQARDWENRRHFLSVAARAMRHVLIDHARRRASMKRGGDWQRISLTGGLAGAVEPDTDLIDLSHALSRLERLDESLSVIVDLRVFAGLTMQEIAQLQGVTRRTIHNHWRIATMWLRRELADGHAT